jgi:hypothetical protein
MLAAATQCFEENWVPNTAADQATIEPDMFLVVGFDDVDGKVCGEFAPEGLMPKLLNTPNGKDFALQGIREMLEADKIVAGIVLTEGSMMRSDKPFYDGSIHGLPGSRTCLMVQVHTAGHTTLMTQAFDDKGKADGEPIVIGENPDERVTGRMSLSPQPSEMH